MSVVAAAITHGMFRPPICSIGREAPRRSATSTLPGAPTETSASTLLNSRHRTGDSCSRGRRSWLPHPALRPHLDRAHRRDVRAPHVLHAPHTAARHAPLRSKDWREPSPVTRICRLGVTQAVLEARPSPSGRRETVAGGLHTSAACTPCDGHPDADGPGPVKQGQNSSSSPWCFPSC